MRCDAMRSTSGRRTGGHVHLTFFLGKVHEAPSKT
jgi:hypothetical protein